MIKWTSGCNAIAFINGGRDAKWSSIYALRRYDRRDRNVFYSGQLYFAILFENMVICTHFAREAWRFGLLYDCAPNLHSFVLLP